MNLRHLDRPLRSSFRENVHDGRSNVSQTLNAAGDCFALPAPNDRGHQIQRVIAGRKIFDVPVIAGENDRGVSQIDFREQRANEVCQQDNYLLGRDVILGVTHFVGDEVFEEREPVGGNQPGQNVRGFFRAALRDRLASFPQQAIGEVMINGASRLQVCDDIETEAGSFNRRGRRGYPARTSLEELVGVGVGEDNRRDYSLLYEYSSAASRLSSICT